MSLPEKRTKQVSSIKEKDDEVKASSMIGFADDDKLSDRSLEELMPPLLSYNDKCDDHPDELIVAYHKVSLIHLCPQCIRQSNIRKDQYQVYPQII